MPVPTVPALRRTYQAPSSLNGSSGLATSSGSSSPFTNFRGSNVGHFTHSGSPGPSPSLHSTPSSHAGSPGPAGTQSSQANQANQASSFSTVPGKYNGYADLPNQVYRRTVRKGFALNIMVVGETGTGKSTFINSLFSSDIYDGKEQLGISHRIGQTIQVEKTRVTLMEKGVQVRLTIVDVPGFGHYIDNSNTWNSVVAYIDKRYHEYLEREMSVKRNVEGYLDDRVHCCLYFIAPNGRGLKPLDVSAMKALGTKVNVIPVIGRADTLTAEECREFKEMIRRELREHGVKLYDFPTENGEEPEEEEERKMSPTRNGGGGSSGGGSKEANAKWLIPFAVIGSNTFIETKDGRKVRGRKYPWGSVEIDNMDHCDFTLLRRLLLRIHLSDLLDVTENVHYENYRCEYFNKQNGGTTTMIGGGGGGGGGGVQRSPLALLEAEQKDMDGRILKMKTEMQNIFDQKVKEKERKLEDTEKDLEKKYAGWDRDVEVLRRKVEEERIEYEEQKRQLGETFSGFYGILQEEVFRSATDSNSSNASPNNTAQLGSTMLKKSTKSKKSFLEKNFL